MVRKAALILLLGLSACDAPSRQRLNSEQKSEVRQIAMDFADPESGVSKVKIEQLEDELKKLKEENIELRSRISAIDSDLALTNKDVSGLAQHVNQTNRQAHDRLLVVERRMGIYR